MPTITLLDESQEFIDRALQQGKADVIECEGIDGEKWDEYEMYATDYRKLLKLPYNLNKRAENGKSEKISTGLKEYSLAREKAKVIWKEYTDKLYTEKFRVKSKSLV